MQQQQVDDLKVGTLCSNAASKPAPHTAMCGCACVMVQRTTHRLRAERDKAEELVAEARRRVASEGADHSRAQQTLRHDLEEALALVKVRTWPKSKVVPPNAASLTRCCYALSLPTTRQRIALSTSRTCHSHSFERCSQRSKKRTSRALHHVSVRAVVSRGCTVARCSTAAQDATLKSLTNDVTSAQNVRAVQGRVSCASFGRRLTAVVHTSCSTRLTTPTASLPTELATSSLCTRQHRAKSTT